MLLIQHIETHSSLTKGKHKLTDTTQHEVKKPAYDIDISRSHRKRKSDLELEDDEKPLKIPSKYMTLYNVLSI